MPYDEIEHILGRSVFGDELGLQRNTKKTDEKEGMTQGGYNGSYQLEVLLLKDSRAGHRATIYSAQDRGSKQSLSLSIHKREINFEQKIPLAKVTRNLTITSRSCMY